MSVKEVPVLAGAIHSPDKKYHVMWWNTGVLSLFKAPLPFGSAPFDELLQTTTSDPDVWDKIRKATGLGANAPWVEAAGVPQTPLLPILKIVSELLEKLGPCTCRDCTMYANAELN